MLTYKEAVEHPIKMYIRRDLGITVEQFGLVAGIPQPTLATWIRRDRRIEKLPIDFFVSLAKVTHKTIDQTFNELIVWQQRYDRYKQEVSRQAEESLFAKASREGTAVFKSYKELQQEIKLVEPAKKLKSAILRKDLMAAMQATITIYSELDRALPIWMQDVFSDSEHLQEGGAAFLNELIKI